MLKQVKEKEEERTGMNDKMFKNIMKTESGLKLMKGIIEEVEGMLAPVDKALRHMIATALTRFCVSYSM